MNILISWEAQRLNQLSSTDCIWSGSVDLLVWNSRKFRLWSGSDSNVDLLMSWMKITALIITTYLCSHDPFWVLLVFGLTEFNSTSESTVRIMSLLCPTEIRFGSWKVRRLNWASVCSARHWGNDAKLLCSHANVFKTHLLVNIIPFCFNKQLKSYLSFDELVWLPW